MKSLHFKLFLRYAAFLFCIFLTFIIILYLLWGNMLRENSTSELQADCDNISVLLDTQMEQVDELSKRIVSSSQIQNLFLRDLYSYGIEAYENRSSFSDALFDIIKLSFEHMALNMLDTEGRYINVGTTSLFEKREPAEFQGLDWFQTTLEAYGKKVILATRLPELNPSKEPVVSLLRAFAPGRSKEETAVLEIQVQYDYLAQRIENSIHNREDIKKIFVYNESGERIYPFETDELSEAEEDMIQISKAPEKSDQSIITTGSGNTKTLLGHRRSEFTDWTVFVTAKEREIFSAYYQFRILIVAVSVLVFGIMLFVTYQIATRLTLPLKQLEEAARTLSFDNLDSFEMPDMKSNFQEVDSLYHSFEQMRQNLKTSLQEVVSAHTMAVDAKMLALQSQMNPHFLYNTLASIGILAEDGQDEKIVEMCSDLSSLLRYISSGSSMSVELSQEISQTVAYIHLIKVKYEERIQFHIEIDEAMAHLHVPKLVIQPLVENCVKYALNVDPPWIITITGKIQDHNWIITVADNGAGFEEEYLKRFEAESQQIKMEQPLPDLAINGMGLLNLYIRLYFTYKEQMIFELKNMESGGAVVIVGGPFLPEADK